MKIYKNILNGKEISEKEISELKENSLLKIRPELWEEWDFLRNIDIDISKVTKGSEKIVFWKCKKCNSSFDLKVEHRKRGMNCPYCRGLRINKTNSLKSLRPDIAKLWSENNNISPNEIGIGSSKEFYWNCEECKEVYKMSVNKKTNGRGCPFCAGYRTSKKMSLGGIYPEISKEWHPIKNGELTPFDVSKSSGKKVWWKCNNCNSDYQMTIDKRTSMKYNAKTCKICSNGMSFGEKIMYKILSDSDINFEKEKVFTWKRNSKYDFYLPEHSCIIEIHGMQHYKETFSKLGGRTLKEEKENDELKRKKALENGIKNYFEIPCLSFDIKEFKSNLQKNNLLNILKIENYDFNLLNHVSINETVSNSWELYNQGMGIISISNELKMNRSTIRKYIKLGKELKKISR